MSIHERKHVPAGLGALALIAGGAVVALGLCSSSAPPQQQSGINDAPVVVVPVATATSEPSIALRLTLALPDDMDAEQRYWHWKAAQVAACPRCIAVDRDRIPTLADNENANTVWLALIWTESKYRPWAINETSGACGLGQLLSSHLANPITCAIPEWNLYTSAAEFARLIDDNGGDIMAALRLYKGVTSWDTTYQANSVFDVVKVGAK